MTSATLTIEPRPLAARLRIRRGQVMRWSVRGEAQEFRVVSVSTPDDAGRCEVRLESA